MRLAILILFCVLQTSFSLSQLTFNTYYNSGSPFNSEISNTIARCHDGAIIGTNQSLINYGNFAIFKTDSSGNLLWQKNYQTGISTSSGAQMIGMLSDSTVIVYLFESNLVSSGFCIIKLDLSGNVIWSKLYNTASGIGQSVHQLRPNGDGGCMISSGNTQVYIDKLGDVVSSFQFINGGVFNDNLPLDTVAFRFLSELPNNEIALFDYYHTGNILNYTQITILNDSLQIATHVPCRHIAKSANGGSYVLLKLDGDGISVFKTDSLNQPIWAKKIVLPGVVLTRGLIVSTADGGCIVGGSFYDSGFDPYVLKLDATGNLVWFKIAGNSNFPLTNDFDFNYLIPDGSNGFYGNLYAKNLHVFHVDSAFNGLCAELPGVPLISNLTFSSTASTQPAINPIALSSSNMNITPSSVITYQYDACTGMPTNAPWLNDDYFGSMSVYPNPVIDFITVEFNKSVASNIVASVYNSIGELVLTQQILDQKTEISFNFPSGIYTMEIESTDGVYVKKVIKL